MGCFSTCFGTCKRVRRRRRRSSINNKPSLLDHLQKYESVDGFQVPNLIEEQEEEKEKGENQIELTPDSNDEKREKVNSSERKKVTFDLNVKIYEDIPTFEEEVTGKLEENNEEEREKIAQYKTQYNSDSSSSSLFSFPTNHRYRNCRDSDDEFDELLLSDESGMDDDDYDDEYDDDDDEVESEVKNDKHVKFEDQSSESLFSLSLDSRKKDFGAEIGDREVNSPMPIRNSSANESNSEEFDRNSRKYVDSVLNPVENLTQWKFVKARSKLASKDHQAKENVISGQDLSFPVKKKEPLLGKDLGVDTSLSNWLVSSEGTGKYNSRSSSVSVGNSPSDSNKISPNKFEDRPILGALTVEELRQISASSSPRKSPSKSPEDAPIIGSVGSYWSHTGQTPESNSSTISTRSRFRESAEVIWDPTPFETKLEKALEKEGNAEHVLAM